MNIPQNAIYERSNDKHPGLVVMQDSTTSKVPIGKFIDTGNTLLDMLELDSEFFTFISSSLETKDDINKLINLRNQVSHQIAKLAVPLKNKYGPITLPDPYYFAEKYEKIKKAIEAGRITAADAALTLTTEFVEKMQTSVKRNKLAAREVGVTVPEFNLESGGIPIDKSRHKK